jgi:sugar lactone lactonase YvrE
MTEGKVARIADCSCEVGENPLWHPFEKRVYWCDIPRGTIFRYDPKSRGYCQCFGGGTVGGFTIERDGALLLFMDKGAIMRWQRGKTTTIRNLIPGEEDTRFNDVIADPAGRVFCGTMSTGSRPGRLYRLDLDGTISVVSEGIGCSNGMAFSPDLKHFFHTDSFAREIYRFDYDQESGSITNKQLYMRSADVDGLPDGATIDAQGSLWSAHWDGGCLIRYSPGGTEDRRIQIPARRVTSLTFGGDELLDVFVTTARGINEDQDRAGALFHFKADTPGLPEHLSRICCELSA